MTNDPLAQFKAAQREGWALFAPLEVHTTRAAAALVSFAEIRAGQKVLDVASGTGVVAVTAARIGAEVRALDLSPVLLEHAGRNAETAGVTIDLREGDVEALPYESATFDVVASQFGHMFAPRPEIAIAEMLRVLKPGGRIAFSTWPPDHVVGRMFALIGRYLQAPPGVAPPPAWGDPTIVRERLGGAVTDLRSEYGEVQFSALSPEHYRRSIETTAAPVVRLVTALASEPAKLAEFRAGLDALAAEYFADNVVRQRFLMTRATKL